MSEKNAKDERHEPTIIEEAEPIYQQIIAGSKKDGKLDMALLLDNITMHIACQMVKLSKRDATVAKHEADIELLKKQYWRV